MVLVDQSSSHTVFVCCNGLSVNRCVSPSDPTFLNTVCGAFGSRLRKAQSECLPSPFDRYDNRRAAYSAIGRRSSSTARSRIRYSGLGLNRVTNGTTRWRPRPSGPSLAEADPARAWGRVSLFERGGAPRVVAHSASFRHRRMFRRWPILRGSYIRYRCDADRNPVAWLASIRRLRQP